jgi:hypothetical protein
MAKRPSPAHIRPPRTATQCAKDYFAAAWRDLQLFHFVIDTVLVGDYVAHVAKLALDGKDISARLTPVELARKEPGPRTKALRDQRQLLLEMFVARSIDNFGRYLVDVIRTVLQKQPAMLKSRQQSLTLEEILQHTSIDDLVRSIIEARVNALSYEGFDSMLAWCTDRGIPLGVPAGKRDDVVELIATRNLIAHNRCIVDERYVRIVQGTTRKIGEVRSLELEDLEKCQELLTGIVVATDIETAKKFKVRRVRLRTAPPAKGPGEVSQSREATALDGGAG